MEGYNNIYLIWMKTIMGISYFDCYCMSCCMDFCVVLCIYIMWADISCSVI